MQARVGHLSEELAASAARVSALSVALSQVAAAFAAARRREEALYRSPRALARAFRALVVNARARVRSRERAHVAARFYTKASQATLPAILGRPAFPSNSLSVLLRPYPTT
jgi:hypothetical protein